MEERKVSGGTVTMKPAGEWLQQSLSERWMPEHVIKVLFDCHSSGALRFGTGEQTLLAKALPRWAQSSMSTAFAKAAGMDRQLKVASELFPGIPVPSSKSPEALRSYIDALRASMYIAPDAIDFKANRLSKKERVATKGQAWIGARFLPRGHRQYNKRFRFLARLEKHFASRGAVAEMRDLAQIAKSRLASKIDPAALTDLNTLCFVAYMAAKLNKRSVFTFAEQERPYDTIADMLFKRITSSTAWLQVAYVHPVHEVLVKLSEEEKGKLLGIWFAIMRRAAKVLDSEAKAGGIDLKNLIVQRGNDSSTWNEAAGAYNKARDGWIGTLYALGMEQVLDGFAPGKALRLMAADVAYGHMRYGDGLEPNTAVWGLLPKPWEVILHDALCTREMIEQACASQKADVIAGWLAPRKKSIAAYTPTPELVHGVIVSSPDLAQHLKACGYFAGPSKA